MKVSNEMLKALRRKRGEQNISVIELSRQTGVSRWTLDKLLKGAKEDIRPTTADKLNQWLYKLV
ncbi:helix-turn-helix domain-containing protein [Weissella cibaria]|uniref:helix-turn-helix domain-containing protein n=1 Tax=Weissella cibaria TaxID=137591 RepID=UPI000D52E50D|nr:helix-turn-helix transcriptional regulator [Weissella cibaria]